MPTSKGFVASLAVLLGLAIVAGVGFNLRTLGELRQVRSERAELESKNQELAVEVRTLEERLQAAQAAPEQPEQQEVTLYFVVSKPTEFVLVPEQRQIEGDEDPRVLAVRELIAGPKDTDGAQAVIPQGTEVLGLQVEDGVATVNLSSDIRRMNVGAALEGLAVTSIVNTLTEFADVTKVRLLVEGNVVDTLAGHVDISGILERDERPVERS